MKPLRSLSPAILLVACFASAPLSAQVSEERMNQYRTVDTDLPKAAGGGVDRAEVEKGIVSRANDFRESEGLDPLETQDRLAQAARDFAAYMARTHRYGHEADGKKPADRVSEAGYAFCYVAENIGYQYRSEPYEVAELAGAFMTGWKNSPGHRRNLLRDPAMHTGVGVARSEKTGAYFAVQLFARPESAKVSFQVTNETGEEVAYRVSGLDRPEGREFVLPPRATATHERCSAVEMLLPKDGGDESLRIEDGDLVVLTGERGEVAARVESE